MYGKILWSSSSCMHAIEAILIQTRVQNKSHKQTLAESVQHTDVSSFCFQNTHSNTRKHSLNKQSLVELFIYNIQTQQKEMKICVKDNTNASGKPLQFNAAKGPKKYPQKKEG